MEDYVGGTPLVRLQRLPGKTSNIILAKLEGNNPAGSVKDRCARHCKIFTIKIGLFHGLQNLFFSKQNSTPLLAHRVHCL